MINYLGCWEALVHWFCQSTNMEVLTGMNMNQPATLAREAFWPASMLVWSICWPLGNAGLKTLPWLIGAKVQL